MRDGKTPESYPSDKCETRHLEGGAFVFVA